MAGTKGEIRELARKLEALRDDVERFNNNHNTAETTIKDEHSKFRTTWITEGRASESRRNREYDELSERIQKLETGRGTNRGAISTDNTRSINKPLSQKAKSEPEVCVDLTMEDGDGTTNRSTNDSNELPLRARVDRLENGETALRLKISELTTDMESLKTDTQNTKSLVKRNTGQEPTTSIVTSGTPISDTTCPKGDEDLPGSCAHARKLMQMGLAGKIAIAETTLRVRVMKLEDEQDKHRKRQSAFITNYSKGGEQNLGSKITTLRRDFKELGANIKKDVNRCGERLSAFEAKLADALACITPDGRDFVVERISNNPTTSRSANDTLPLPTPFPIPDKPVASSSLPRILPALPSTPIATPPVANPSQFLAIAAEMKAYIQVTMQNMTIIAARVEKASMVPPANVTFVAQVKGYLEAMKNVYTMATKQFEDTKAFHEQAVTDINCARKRSTG